MATPRELAARLTGLAPPVVERQAPAPGAQEWPAIDGIDSHDAAPRADGDLRLFLSLLRRLLGDAPTTSRPTP